MKFFFYSRFMAFNSKRLDYYGNGIDRYRNLQDSQTRRYDGFICAELDRYRNLQGSQTLSHCSLKSGQLDRYRNLQGSQTGPHEQDLRCSLTDIVIYKVLKPSEGQARASTVLDRYRNLQGSQTRVSSHWRGSALDRYRNLQGSQTGNLLL